MFHVAIQIYPCLSVFEFEPAVFHLFPAETDDLAPAAACQQQQADDIGLLRLRGGAAGYRSRTR